MLIAKAQRQMNKEAHRGSGYALAECGLCKGLGSGVEDSCLSCKGKGVVLVHLPAIKCPRCSGNGKTAFKDKAILYSALCVNCNGAGWATTMKE